MHTPLAAEPEPEFEPSSSGSSSGTPRKSTISKRVQWSDLPARSPTGHHEGNPSWDPDAADKREHLMQRLRASPRTRARAREETARTGRPPPPVRPAEAPSRPSRERGLAALAQPAQLSLRSARRGVRSSLPPTQTVKGSTKRTSKKGKKKRGSKKKDATKKRGSKKKDATKKKKKKSTKGKRSRMRYTLW